MGIDDARLGQRVVAVVTLADGAGEAAVDGIVTQATAAMADAGQLDAVVVTDDIPRNGSGKIDYPAVISTLKAGIAD